MTLSKRWAGRAFGTNAGNIFVTFDGEDSALSGDLRLNDTEYGLIIFKINGSFDGDSLSITGHSVSNQEKIVEQKIAATAKVSPSGELRGDWSTDIGAAGTFVLHPHDLVSGSASPVAELPQLFTARYDLGAAVIGRDDIVRIARKMAVGFTIGKPIITIVSDTEQSMFLENFEGRDFKKDRATFAKIRIQEPEGNGIDRIISVEFGQTANLVMTQGSDESWVLGRREILKSYLGDVRRSYTTSLLRVSSDFYQIMILFSIVYMPSLENFHTRVAFFILVLIIFYGSLWIQRRYIPFSVIYVGQRKISIFRKIAPAVGSWIIAATAGVAAAIAGTYLQVWLQKLGG